MPTAKFPEIKVYMDKQLSFEKSGYVNNIFGRRLTLIQ